MATIHTRRCRAEAAACRHGQAGRHKESATVLTPHRDAAERMACGNHRQCRLDDSDKLGKGDEKVKRLSNLINIFKRLI